MKNVVDKIDSILDGWDKDAIDAMEKAEEVADYHGRFEILRVLDEARDALLQHMQHRVSTGTTGNQWFTIPSAPIRESQK